MDCEFDDKKIEDTINEKLRYLKFKGLQYGWNVVDSRHKAKPIDTAELLKKEKDKVDEGKPKNNKQTNKSNKNNKKHRNNYSQNDNNYVNNRRSRRFNENYEEDQGYEDYKNQIQVSKFFLYKQNH